MLFDQYQQAKHLPVLDGIRGISILLVITVHLYYINFSWAWLSGYLGVSIFFVLSGFLITMLALREEARTGCLGIKAFYIRRSFRIFPLYFLVLGAYYVIVILLGFGGENEKIRFGAALPYYLVYLNEFAPPAPYYQSWSLGIEEKFYLVWPFLAFIIFRKAPRDRAIITGFLLLTFLMLSPLFQKSGLIHYHSILIGCLLAIIMEDRASFEQLSFLGKGFWPTLSIFLMLTIQLSVKPFPQLQYLYPFIVGMWLVSVLQTPPNWLMWRPLTYFGERSYGIYLVHILCLRGVKFIFPASTTVCLVSIMGLIAGTALSVVVAEVLYRTIERPCIRMGRRLVTKTDPIKPEPASLSVS